MLIRHGLLRGPRLRSSTPSHSSAPSPARSLREALAELGPEAALFGRYLSTRLDIVPFDLALSLRDLPLQAPPLQSPDLSTGAAPWLGDRLAAVDPRPSSAGFGWLAYRGLAPDGRAVEARCLDALALESASERLEVLQRSLLRVLGAAPWFLPTEDLYRDFLRHDWRQRTDSNLQRSVWQRLGREAEAVDELAVPRADLELSSEGVLVLEIPATTAVSSESRERRRFHERTLRRRAASACLQSALTAGLFPVNARWALASDGRALLLDGTFADLSTAERPRAWDFLRALSRQDPDRAMGALLSCFEPAIGWGSLEDRRRLRSDLRFVVPFRDGSWTRSGDSLAETTAHSWRIFAGHGFRLSEGWTGFFRSMVLRSLEAFDQESDRDALKEGLEALQWRAGWNQLRQMTEPRTMFHQAERYTLGLLEWPQALDKLLDDNDPAKRALGGTAPHRASTRKGARKGWFERYGAVAGGAMGLVALAVAGPEVIEVFAGSEPWVAMLILGLGALVLTLIFRGDPR